VLYRPSDRQTDRQTDHATRSVTIGRIYVRSTAMQPNNNNKSYVATCRSMDSRKKYAKITSCSVPTILLQQTKARTYKCRKYTFTLNTKLFITFRVRHSRGEMYTGHGRLCVCMCVSVPRRIPTLLHGPECNLGVMAGVPSSCALLDGFAIRA